MHLPVPFCLILHFLLTVYVCEILLTYFLRHPPDSQSESPSHFFPLLSSAARMMKNVPTFAVSTWVSSEHSPNAERLHSPSIPCWTQLALVERGPPSWCAGREAGVGTMQVVIDLPLDVWLFCDARYLWDVCWLSIISARWNSLVGWLVGPTGRQKGGTWAKLKSVSKFKL